MTEVVWTIIYNRVNRGDMDNNDIRLYNEDCMEVLKRLPDNSVDLIVTDPPYLIEKSSGGAAWGIRQ